MGLYGPWAHGRGTGGPTWEHIMMTSRTSCFAEGPHYMLTDAAVLQMHSACYGYNIIKYFIHTIKSQTLSCHTCCRLIFMRIWYIQLHVRFGLAVTNLSS